MKAQCLSIFEMIIKMIRNRQVCATVQDCRVFINKSLCMKSLWFFYIYESFDAKRKFEQLCIYLIITENKNSKSNASVFFIYSLFTAT